MKNDRYKASLHLLISILVITVINYLDRSAISFAILPLKRELGINNAEFGWIAAAFGIGYLCMCLFGGIIVDRFGPAKVWPLFAVLWSLSIFGLGFSQGFLSLFFFRLVLGLAEAIHFPALLRVIADHMSPKWRASAISIGLFGVPAASMIGAPLLSWIVVDFGWRWMFFLLGSLGILWALYWSLCLRKKVELQKKPSFQNSSDLGNWKELLTSKAMWVNGIQFFSLGYIIFFALIWLPGFFEEMFHEPILKTGFMIVLPWAISAISVVLGGWFSDWLKKKTGSLWYSRALVIGGSLFLSGISFSFVALTSNASMALFFIMLGLGLAFFTNAPIFSLNADLFPKKSGTAQGIITMLFALAGIIAPALTGAIVQVTHSFLGVFIIIALLTLLSLFLTLTTCKRDL